MARIDTYAASGSGIHPSTIASKVSGSLWRRPLPRPPATQRGHVFEVNRTSPGGPLPTVTMGFTFVIDWETHLAIDLLGPELARGGAFFGISGFESGIDSIVLDVGMPGMLVSHGTEIGWQFNPMYSTPGGSPVDEIHHIVVTGSTTALAGMVGEFSHYRHSRLCRSPPGFRAGYYAVAGGAACVGGLEIARTGAGRVCLT